jgi:uncharacterized protein YggT (Ycf19 family)
VEAPVQFIEYWYFHIPNYVLAALMYSLLARFILSFFFPAGSTNYIFRAFVRLTDPVLWLLGFVTPHAVPFLLRVLFAAMWLFIFRFAFWAVLRLFDLSPPLTA